MEYALIGFFQNDDKLNIDVFFKSNNVNEVFIIRDLINELEYGNSKCISQQTIDIWDYLSGFISLNDSQNWNGYYIQKLIMVKVIKYEEMELMNHGKT